MCVFMDLYPARKPPCDRSAEGMPFASAWIGVPARVTTSKYPPFFASCLHPSEFLLPEREGFRITRRKVRSRSAIEPKTFAIDFFVVGVERRDMAAVIHAPEKAAVLLVPKGVVEELQPMFCDWEKPLFRLGM